MIESDKISFFEWALNKVTPPQKSTNLAHFLAKKVTEVFGTAVLLIISFASLGTMFIKCLKGRVTQDSSQIASPKIQRAAEPVLQGQRLPAAVPHPLSPQEYDDLLINPPQESDECDWEDTYQTAFPLTDPSRTPSPAIRYKVAQLEKIEEDLSRELRTVDLRIQRLEGTMRFEQSLIQFEASGVRAPLTLEQNQVDLEKLKNTRAKIRIEKAKNLLRLSRIDPLATDSTTSVTPSTSPDIGSHSASPREKDLIQQFKETLLSIVIEHYPNRQEDVDLNILYNILYSIRVSDSSQTVKETCRILEKGILLQETIQTAFEQPNGIQAQEVLQRTILDLFI